MPKGRSRPDIMDDGGVKDPVAIVTTLLETTVSSDPGDKVQGFFRYQAGYGVVLLIAAVTRYRPYVSIWCEHHEDLLAVCEDGFLEAYQVKTRAPELGTWNLSDSELKKSIKRFIGLDHTFPGKVRKCFFVSNAEASKSEAKKELEKSPIHFFKAVQKARIEDETIAIDSPFDNSFKKLLAHCECTAPQLLGVLKKTDFLKGPGRDSFEAEISNEHIPTISECCHYTTAQLNALRDELIRIVQTASTFRTTDPKSHLLGIISPSEADPRILAKRIDVKSVIEKIRESKPIPLRFAPLIHNPLSPTKGGDLRVMSQKMQRGGLADQVESMINRTTAAERHLLEMASRDPDECQMVCDQLYGVVKGECDEAKLFTSTQSSLYGPEMYRDVLKRLRGITETKPEMVCHQAYECLVGVAGLLTGECTVWWSAPFKLEDAP